MCLSACDCLCLVDALLRAIFLVDQQQPQGQVRRPASPVAEELAQAQAETERLRQELVPRRVRRTLGSMSSI